MTDTMPSQKKTKKPARVGTQINIVIDTDLRAKVDAWIADYNAKHDHRATLTSVVEAALRKYTATPEKPPE